MQLGVGLPTFASDSHIVPPGRLVEFARRAEGRGFAGGWVIEHLLRPPTYATSLLDPLAALSAVAGATETLPLGTSVLLLPLRNPVLVAKRVATIQHLSERRFTLGLGAGYVPDEFDAVGVPREERGARLREGLELLAGLFSGSAVTFDGDAYSVDGFRLEPDLRRPPRLLAGGSGVERDGERRVPEGVTRRLDHADGWIAPPAPPDVLAGDWADFAGYLDDRGRDPSRMDRVALQYLHLEPGDVAATERSQRTVYRGLVGPDRTVDHAEENWLFGPEDAVREALAAYEDAGFDQVILHPATREPAELDRQLRLWADRLLPDYA